MTASYSWVKCLYVYFIQTIPKRLNIIKLTFHECIFIAVYKKRSVSVSYKKKHRFVSGKNKETY